MKDHLSNYAYVWKAGRAVWVLGADAYYHGDARRPYPRVMCETCGQPATTVSLEVVDMTLPEDECIGKLPGKPHHYCQDHIIDHAHS